MHTPMPTICSATRDNTNVDCYIPSSTQGACERLNGNQRTASGTAVSPSSGDGRFTFVAHPPNRLRTSCIWPLADNIYGCHSWPLIHDVHRGNDGRSPGLEGVSSFLFS